MNACTSNAMTVHVCDCVLSYSASHSPSGRILRILPDRKRVAGTRREVARLREPPPEHRISNRSVRTQVWDWCRGYADPERATRVAYVSNAVVWVGVPTGMPQPGHEQGIAPFKSYDVGDTTYL